MVESKKKKSLAEEQMEVRGTKFEKPFAMEEHISRKINLPSGYGKDRIVAMVRDPWWVFFYWEITPQRQKAIREEMKKNKEDYRDSIIRIYDITGIDNFTGSNAHSYFDITLKNMANNWYVDVGAPGRKWCVEIGLMSHKGNFYALARSNVVNTPRYGMSDILDETWMLSEEEYWWLFGASGGFDVGKSSLEMKELFMKQLKGWVSSGAMFSLGSHILQQKK